MSQVYFLRGSELNNSAHQYTLTNCWYNNIYFHAKPLTIKKSFVWIIDIVTQISRFQF